MARHRGVPLEPKNIEQGISNVEEIFPSTGGVAAGRGGLQSEQKTFQTNKKITDSSTNAGGEKIASTDVILAPEESTSLTLSEPGAITKLLVQLSAENYQQALRSTVISMEFDGQRTAWLPVGALGGVGYSAEKNDTFYIKTDPETGTVSSYYVMPFRKTAVITLTNHGEQDVTIKQF